MTEHDYLRHRDWCLHLAQLGCLMSDHRGCMAAVAEAARWEPEDKELERRKPGGDCSVRHER